MMRFFRIKFKRSYLNLGSFSNAFSVRPYRKFYGKISSSSVYRFFCFFLVFLSTSTLLFFKLLAFDGDLLLFDERIGLWFALFSAFLWDLIIFSLLFLESFFVLETALLLSRLPFRRSLLEFDWVGFRPRDDPGRFLWRLTGFFFVTIVRSSF